mmetsp:Transcript_9726/g.9808  ORF Transcript_9726/g.9808 Transcript_9726/m.9808 type:complete len:454 (+) Transcript_9726:359-1720(+)
MRAMYNITRMALFTMIVRTSGSIESSEYSYVSSLNFSGFSLDYARNICIHVLNKTYYSGHKFTHVNNMYLRYSLDPLSPIRDIKDYNFVMFNKLNMLDDSKPLSTLHKTTIRGKTFLPNCAWATTYNNAHLLFGLNKLFEWTINKPKTLPHFDRIYFAYCIAPSKIREWHWGSTFLKSILHDLSEKNISSPVLMQPNRKYVDHLTCFEELYGYASWGILLSSAKAALRFREKTISPGVFYGHTPLRDISFNRYEDQFHEILPYVTQQDEYRLVDACATKKLRIAYYHRDPSDSRPPRGFTNPQDIIATCQRFTTRPVVTLSTSHHESIDAQFVIFNSFDILVAAAGSHLTNMILINRTDVGFVEVGVAIRDEFWRENALYKLNLKSYRYSHDHRDMSEKLTQKRDENCIRNNVTGGIECGYNTARKVTDGMIEVDSEHLAETLRLTVRDLCEL